MTINRCDHELGRLLEAIESLVRVKTEIVFVTWRNARKHLNVGAGAEKLLTFTGDYDDLDSFIHPRIEDRAIELLHHLVAVRVRRWIVESDQCEAIMRFIIQS